MAISVCGLVALFRGQVAECSAADAPDILLILVDDMGYGDPGCFNSSSKIRTPVIDRLAAEGMRFTDAHSAGPVCHPSRYGLMTGRYPFRTDVSVWPSRPVLGPDEPTVASVLRSAGYSTAMTGKWHLGFQESGYENPLPGGPVDHGFDQFFGFRASTDIPPYFYIRNLRAVSPPTSTIEEHHTEGVESIQGEFWRAGGISPDLQLKDVLPDLAGNAVRTIRDHAARAGDSPLFLYLALTAPHTPWLPSKEFQGKSDAGMYGDFVMMTDAVIGQVLQALEETGRAEKTLVIFTSDNGPTWYPEDVQRTGHDSCGGLRGMKGSHWEAGHRVPFIVRWPGVTKAGSVSHQLICFTDVLATLAEVAETGLSDNAGADSFSFASVLRGTHDEATPLRESLAIGKSVRMGTWKWIEGREQASFHRPDRGVIPPVNEPPGQLFDLSSDPGETTNLAAKHSEIAKKLADELARIRSVSQTRNAK